MKDTFWSLNILFLLICIKYSSLTEYTPSDRIIKVAQNGSYIFGVEAWNVTDTAQCRFSSDTGIQHWFNVIPSHKGEQIEDRYGNNEDFPGNTVDDLREMGLCQISVYNAQENGPKSWNLEAYDYDNKMVANATFTVEFTQQ